MLQELQRILEPVLSRLADPDTREKVIIFLVGGTATYLLPKILSWLGTFIAWIGHVIGGRLSRSYRRRRYLNWVVLQNRDLNLTGVVTGSAKPHLDQIFVSLKLDDSKPVRSKPETPSRLTALVTRLLEALSLNPKSGSNQSPANREWVMETQDWEPRFFARDGAGIIVGAIAMWLVIGQYVFRGVYLEDGASREAAAILAGVVTAAGSVLAVRLFNQNRKVSRRLLVLVSPNAFTIPLLLVNGAQGVMISVGATIGVVIAGAGVAFVHYAGRNLRTPRKAKELGALVTTSNHFAIVGGPGSGKSTCLQFLALTFAREKAGERRLRQRRAALKQLGCRRWRMPILIPLRKLAGHVGGISAGGTPSLLNAYCAHILPGELRDLVTPEMFVPYLEKGKCLFLLDGLDEVVDDVTAAHLIDELRGLMSRYPNNQFILTCRSSAWKGNLDSLFSRVDIKSLTTEQVSEFVNTWYESVELNKHSWRKGQTLLKLHRSEAAKKANALMRGLSESASLSRLSENPLLLSIICFVHYSKDLPRERLTLYRDCAELLLVQWDAEKGIEPADASLTNARRAAIMQELAFRMHSGFLGTGSDRKEANRANLIQVVQELLNRFGLHHASAEDVFEKLSRRSGILVPTDDTRQHYVFTHLTFQEFYTANYIHERHLDVFDVIAKAGDVELSGVTSWWKEVLLLVAVLKKNPTPIVKRLTRDSDFASARLQLAAQCVEESVESCDAELENSVLQSMLNARLGKELPLTDKWAEDLKQYLLGASRWPDFSAFSIAAKLSQLQTVPDARNAIQDLDEILRLMPSLKGPRIAEARLELALEHRLEDVITVELVMSAFEGRGHEGIRGILDVLRSIPSHKLRAAAARSALHKWLNDLKAMLTNRVDVYELRLDIRDIEDLEFIAAMSQIAESLTGADKQEIADLCKDICATTWTHEALLLSRMLGGLRTCLLAIAAACSGAQRNELVSRLRDIIKTGPTLDAEWALRTLGLVSKNEGETADMCVASLTHSAAAVRMSALETLLYLDSGVRRLRTSQSAIRNSCRDAGFVVSLGRALLAVAKNEGTLGYSANERRVAIAGLALAGLELPPIEVRKSAWSNCFADDPVRFWLIPYFEADAELAHHVIDMAGTALGQKDRHRESLRAYWLLLQVMRRNDGLLRERAAEVALNCLGDEVRTAAMATAILYDGNYRIRKDHAAVEKLRRQLKLSPQFEAHASFWVLRDIWNDASAA